MTCRRAEPPSWYHCQCCSVPMDEDTFAQQSYCEECLAAGCDEEEEDTLESPAISPSPDNLVCSHCGSAEVECLDWVRVNDNVFVGGNESMPADDYWCPACQVHEKPILARDYCAATGHTGSPCKVCGEAP